MGAERTINRLTCQGTRLCRAVHVHLGLDGDTYMMAKGIPYVLACACILDFELECVSLKAPTVVLYLRLET